MYLHHLYVNDDTIMQETGECHYICDASYKTLVRLG